MIIIHFLFIIIYQVVSSNLKYYKMETLRKRKVATYEKVVEAADDADLHLTDKQV